MILRGDVSRVQGASHALGKRLEREHLSDVDRDRLAVEMLSLLRPSLSSLFESSMARVMPVDTNLAAHLSLFKMLYDGVEDKLKELSRNSERFRASGKSLLTEQEIEYNKSRALDGFRLAATHATCAGQLLDKLILGRMALFHRLVRKVMTPRSERQCVELLKKGE